MTELLTRPMPAAVPPPAPRQRSLIAVTARWTIGTLGVLALWFFSYVLVIGAAQESGSQQRLYADFRSQLSQATAPVSVAREGRPVALIDSPALHLSHAVIVEGTSGGDLQKGPGHRRDSVLPGQVGTSVVYGKGATFGAPFAHLPAARVGDPVTVVTGQGTTRYKVTGLRHAGDRVVLGTAPGKGRLTLVTVVGEGWRSRWAPGTTLYVDAEVDTALPAAPVRSGISSSEQLMGQDTRSLLALVLWLEALLVLVAGGVWAWLRWGRWQTWLVVSPALVAVLVACSSLTSRMLPNVL